jgi:hypothetical protein
MSKERKSTIPAIIVGVTILTLPITLPAAYMLYTKKTSLLNRKYAMTAGKTAVILAVSYNTLKYANSKYNFAKHTRHTIQSIHNVCLMPCIPLLNWYYDDNIYGKNKDVTIAWYNIYNKPEKIQYIDCWNTDMAQVYLDRYINNNDYKNAKQIFDNMPSNIINSLNLTPKQKIDIFCNHWREYDHIPKKMFNKDLVQYIIETNIQQAKYIPSGSWDLDMASYFINKRTMCIYSFSYCDALKNIPVEILNKIYPNDNTREAIDALMKYTENDIKYIPSWYLTTDNIRRIMCTKIEIINYIPDKLITDDFVDEIQLDSLLDLLKKEKNISIKNKLLATKLVDSNSEYFKFVDNSAQTKEMVSNVLKLVKYDIEYVKHLAHKFKTKKLLKTALKETNFDPYLFRHFGQNASIIKFALKKSNYKPEIIREINIYDQKIFDGIVEHCLRTGQKITLNNKYVSAAYIQHYYSVMPNFDAIKLLVNTNIPAEVFNDVYGPMHVPKIEDVNCKSYVSRKNGKNVTIYECPVTKLFVPVKNNYSQCKDCKNDLLTLTARVSKNSIIHVTTDGKIHINNFKLSE